MELNIPTTLFEEGTARVRADQAEVLREKLKCQYPWLSDNAIDVILKSSSEEMSRHIETKKPPSQKAREMLVEGRYEQALSFLDVHLDLEPGDVDCWYVRSEALFKLGRKEEAFQSMRTGQRLAQSQGKLSGPSRK
jgi:tetratricopeptide (TPR) repeat protein